MVSIFRRWLTPLLLFSGLVFSSQVFAKTYDLVLVHGLANKHRWGSAFLTEVANTWGSGNVYVVFTNTSTRVYTKTFNGKVVTFIGEDDHNAGKDYIQVQAQNMDKKIQILKTSYGLSSQFDIIGHSMGGLVSRYYAYLRPNTVAGVVTLGTPNQGSPLAANFEWLGKYFLGAENAFKHLQPSYVQGTFNVQYPVGSAPLVSGGKIYTIRGDADGWDCWGWGGELQAGWDWLSLIHWTDSDGLVPTNNVKITGATHLADYMSYDHYDLVLKADVARTAASVLR